MESNNSHILDAVKIISGLRLDLVPRSGVEESKEKFIARCVTPLGKLIILDASRVSTAYVSLDDHHPQVRHTDHLFQIHPSVPDDGEYTLVASRSTFRGHNIANTIILTTTRCPLPKCSSILHTFDRERLILHCVKENELDYDSIIAATPEHLLVSAIFTNFSIKTKDNIVTIVDQDWPATPGIIIQRYTFVEVSDVAFNDRGIVELTLKSGNINDKIVAFFERRFRRYFSSKTFLISRPDPMFDKDAQSRPEWETLTLADAFTIVEILQQLDITAEA